MSIPRRYVRAALVLLVAAGASQAVLHGDAIAARLSVVAELAPRQTGPTLQLDVYQPVAPSFAETSGAIPVLAEPDFLNRLSMPDRLSAPDARSLAVPGSDADCRPSLSATAGEAAMVTLALAAPCLPDTEVTISHSGLQLRGRTGADGRLVVTVPAMQAKASFTAALTGGVVAEATVAVPELRDFDRVAVTWAGRADLELHAFEFGADYDDPGHVWRGNPRAAAVAAAGQGFAILLGAPDLARPERIEVYTFPVRAAREDGRVALTLETQVSTENCGRTIAARTVASAAGIAEAPVDVTLSVPGCDALGDFLVLNNLFDDLKIAAR